MSRVTPPSLGRKISPRRLRLAFLGLGVVLLGTLGVVAAIAKLRLEEAHREREEMVASRVFDEMEREVSAFLELENERPHYARLAQTNPETWAPFVVGYFLATQPKYPESAQVVVAEGKTSEHRRRMTWALEQASAEWRASVAPREAGGQHAPSHRTGSPGPTPVPRRDQREDEPYVALPNRRAPATREESEAPEAAPIPKAVAPTPSKPTSDREIIESLNRAPERRKSAPSAPNESKTNDPFDDYMRSF